MAAGCDTPALRRLIRPRDGPPAETRRPDAMPDAFGRALRRAGAAYPGLAGRPDNATATWDLAAGEVQGLLPDGGLLALLEAAGGHRALCVLDPCIVDALIEVQTTGAVDGDQGPPRPSTNIDATLCRDFVGLLAAGLARELDGAADVTWPLGFSYATHVKDVRQLALLLADEPHHLFRADLSVGEAARKGVVALAVPATGAADSAGAADPVASGADLSGWRRTLLQAPARLEAVLMRRMLSLAEVSALKPGDLLAFDPAELDRVALSPPRGGAVLRGRLGRQAGFRALRLGAGPAERAAPAGPTQDPTPAPAPLDVPSGPPAPADPPPGEATAPTQADAPPPAPRP